MVRLYVKQLRHFLVQLSRLINFAAFAGYAEWVFEVCRLTHLFFVVKDHPWD